MTFSYFFCISGLEGFLSSIPGTRSLQLYVRIRQQSLDCTARVLALAFFAGRRGQSVLPVLLQKLVGEFFFDF